MRFDYSKNPVVKRVDTIEVTTGDYPEILTSNDLNRVQKVLAIRDKVLRNYEVAGYKIESVKFVNGVIDNLIKTNELEGRPLPSVLLFEVEYNTPIVEASTTPVKLKSEAPGSRGYKDYGAYKGNDHIYWS